jgi:hypothetical protein
MDARGGQSPEYGCSPEAREAPIARADPVTSTRGRRLAVAGSVVLLVALGGWFWQARQGSPTPPDRLPATRPDGKASARDASPAVIGGESVNGPRHAASVARVPLPPPDLPLRDSFADLKRRADGGDAHAACRLAAEFDRCDRLREAVHNLELMEAFPGWTTLQANSGARNRTDARKTRLVRALAHCDGAPALEPRQLVHYWRMAALGGHLPSLTHYALGEAFGPRPSLDLLGELQVYRSEAEHLARRAAAAGDPLAWLSLAHAYSPVGRPQSKRWTYLDQAIEPDAVRSLALFQLVQRAYAGDVNMASSLALDVDMLEGAMTGDQRRRAHRLMLRLQGEWQPPDIRQSLDGLQAHVFEPPAKALESCELEARPRSPGDPDPSPHAGVETGARTPGGG